MSVNTKRKVSGKNAARSSAASRRPQKNPAAKISNKNAPHLISDEERDELILNHRENGRKLARSMLRKWRVRMISEEIDSIVDLTLCEAAARYQPSKGAAFMTFFFYHLRGQLVRAVASAAHASNIFLSYTQDETAGEQEDWTFARHDVLRQFLADFLKEQHDEYVTPEDQMVQQQSIEQCRAACAKLDELEQTVLIRSFQDDESLVDIADSLGYSRCHISRVKQRALDTLRLIIEQKDQVQETVTTSTLPKKRARRKDISEVEVALIPNKLAA